MAHAGHEVFCALRVLGTSEHVGALAVDEKQSRTWIANKYTFWNAHPYAGNHLPYGSGSDIGGDCASISYFRVNSSSVS